MLKTCARSLNIGESLALSRLSNYPDRDLLLFGFLSTFRLLILRKWDLAEICLGCKTLDLEVGKSHGTNCFFLLLELSKKLLFLMILDCIDLGLELCSEFGLGWLREFYTLVNHHDFSVHKFQVQD
jgi:hypothetical protein